MGIVSMVAGAEKAKIRKVTPATASGQAIPDSVTVRVDGKSLGLILKALTMIACADENERPVLHSIAVEADTELHKLSLTAANGYILATFQGNEYRLRYTWGFVDHEFANSGEYPVRVQFGLGALLAHRNMSFQANEVAGAREQEIHMKDDGVPYGSARLRISWREFGGQVDYAYSPDIDFGGEFDGDLQDLELKLTFTLEDQGLTVFAGYRRQELPSLGHEGPFAFENDFKLDGYVLGLSFSF